LLLQKKKRGDLFNGVREEGKKSALLLNTVWGGKE